MSYLIKIVAEGVELELRTAIRKRARAMLELAAENNLKCEVVQEVEPRPVKFRNLTQEVPG